jgi:antitoxin component of MazEF toxin-antitoxin module
VLWTEQPSGAAGQSQLWLVQSYDLTSGQSATVVLPNTAASAARAIAGDQVIAITVAGTQLHIISPEARGLRFDAPASLANTPAAACNPALPSNCGQVRTLPEGTLADDGGSWTMRGVQFFLPQYGINGKTLRDDNYAAARDDGSLAFWLERAQIYLRANMLRVFVDLPSTDSGSATVITPTSYSTLHDFATAANARGMRLGLVLHNSADWNMTEPRESWIAGLLDYFAERGSLPTLAYLSADNEINNHCANSGKDCFDTDQNFDAQAYINGALDWVALFRGVVKSRAPQLLVTVGISSEMIDADLTRAAFNFFRPDSQGRNMARLVDLLAPHNFSGGATAIINDLRVGAAYRGAVVLEEFGFPTDPQPRDPSWTEGSLQCAASPLLAECANTAPAFVETNLRALQSGSYAGGSAWMLADMQEKDTATACSDPNKSFALWTGLFAIGGTYCAGGTTSRNAGQPKATALRVCIAYTGHFSACTSGTPFAVRGYLPSVAR